MEVSQRFFHTNKEFQIFAKSSTYALRGVKKQYSRPRGRPAALSSRSEALTFRAGNWHDTPLIFSSVLAESMNPLVGFSPGRFTIAEKGGAVVGFGQVRPLRGGSLELASLVVLPKHRQVYHKAGDQPAKTVLLPVDDVFTVAGWSGLCEQGARHTCRYYVLVERQLK